MNVSAGGMNDATAAFGYSNDANVATAETTTRPPAGPGVAPLVEANFIRGTAGVQTSWLHDVRTGEATTHKYTLSVKVNRPGSYVLSWPEIGTLPKNLALRIKDLSTGAVRSMQTTQSLTVNTGSAAGLTRRFEITVTTK